MQNLVKIENVFRTTLGLTENYDVKNLTYNTIPEWDSIAHMTLIGGLENAFNIMFDTDDILDLSSFNKALEIMTKYGVNVSA